MSIYGNLISINEQITKDSKIYGRPGGYFNSKMKLDTSDLENMKRSLIKVAKKNMLNDNDYKVWGNYEYSVEDLKRRKSLKCGFCFEDESGNYFIYSITNDKFYKLGDSGSLDELFELSLKYIKEIIDEFQSRYFK